jgi:protein-S-isoprenylcysteine O-methyltransferase Ste14
MPSEIDLARLGLLALAWLGYFLIHSALASLAVKRWVAARFRSWMPGYRLAFNALAVLLLIPPLALTYAERGPWFWQWTGVGWWVSNGLAAAALLAIFWSLRWYDGQEFLGLRQWRGRVRRPEDQERFHLSPLHRFVRHPWYSLGLVLIWTRDMDPVFLLTAIMVSLYLAIGARLEEAKLLVYHGEVYRRYRERVPSLIPLPWRYLGPEAVERLLANERK